MKVKSVDERPKLVRRDHEQPALPVTPRRASASGTRDDKQKQQEESSIFIQKLVKGRAIQYLVKYRSFVVAFKIDTKCDSIRLYVHGEGQGEACGLPPPPRLIKLN